MSLPGSKKKQAETLFQNVRWMCETYGAERVGFVTLTFPDLVTCRDEAERRFNSCATNWLRTAYQCGVVVVERHKSGGIHFHGVFLFAENIRGKIDFDAV